MQSTSNTESISSLSACDSIKTVNQTLRQYARACFRAQTECADAHEIVGKARQLYYDQTQDPEFYSFKEGRLMERNIATYNQMIAILVNVFQAQVQQQRGVITLKEKKDIQKKQSQQNFMYKISFVSEAFAIYQTILSVKGIYPDNFTLSQLLRGLKLLWQSQLMNLQNYQQLQQAQMYLESIGKQLNILFSRYGKTIDDIILNSYMDLCVKFQVPGHAIQMYEMMKSANVHRQSEEVKQANSAAENSTSDQSEAAEGEFANASKNKSIQVGILIKAYGQQGQLDQAFKMFEDHLAGNENNDITFGCLIDACVKNGNIEKAERTFQKILEGGPTWMGIKPNTIIYTTMIKAYSRTFKLPKAIEIYEKMRLGSDAMKPNVITYNSIIDCCVRCGDMRQATEIFEHMSQASGQGGVEADLITFSTLIKGHCQAKDIEQALVLHEQMLRLGIKADEVLYNSLLDGCLKADEMDMALKCFKNMRKLKIRASNVTYSILAKIYQKMGEIDKALGILDEMKLEGVKPGVFVYTCMIQTYIQANLIDSAILMFEQMLSAGCIPDNVTYYTLVQGCLIQSRQEYALDLLLQAIYKTIQSNFKPKNKVPCFSVQQAQVLYQLLQKIMINENNQTAVLRFRDLDFILNYLNEIIHPFGQDLDNQENFWASNHPTTFKNDGKQHADVPYNEIRAPLVALDNFQNAPPKYNTLFSDDQFFEPSFNFYQKNF